MADGSITNREITQDDLHPNDLGHQMMADVIIHFLELVYANLEHEREQDNDMPAPITQNAYEHSTRWQNNNYDPVTDGFVRDDTPAERYP